MTNADCPHFQCLLRAEFCYDMSPLHEDEFYDAVVFGVASVQGYALGFHVYVPQFGAVVGRLPIHALCSKPCPRPALETVELWDCFSHHPSVLAYEFLAGRRVETWLRDDEGRYPGEYLFTVDWCGSEYAESAGDLGWKCAHVLQLDNGWLAAQPNNRILWHDQATREGPLERPAGWLLNTHTWSVEGASRHTTDAMFYDVKKEKSHVKKEKSLLMVWYSPYEGADWVPWPLGENPPLPENMPTVHLGSGNTIHMRDIEFHAIRFCEIESDKKWTWDCRNGWRHPGPPDHEREASAMKG